MLPDIQALAPQVFRFTIFWSQIAKQKPVQARNSDDPAYDWSAVDQIVTPMAALQHPGAAHDRLDARPGPAAAAGA